VGTGLLAAIPGVLDYLHTVPAPSSAKVRATRHAVINVSALALMLIAWLTRGDQPAVPAAAVLGLECLAALLIGIGGWMGGVLFSRNQIGVDHRYASAGKWNETSVSARAGVATAVADANELAVDQMKLVRAGSRRIVVARDEERHVAFDDRCTHRGGSLAGGTMICGTVQCPWHGSQFDLRSGAIKAGPAKRPIETFEVDVVGGKVRLTL
jgi:nitrite reductase/ring-hydroxylating ferredoxin subunit